LVTRNLRIVALAGFPAAIVAASTACGALLSIEDRELDTADSAPPIAEAGSSTDATDDGPVVESAEAGLPPQPGSVCNPPECEGIGGKCIDSVCVFDCKEKNGCKQGFTCPANNDCAIDCSGQGSCKDASCQGGRSCTFRCRGNGSCKTVSCKGEVCVFDCFAPDQSCLEGVTCDAKDCEIQCRARHACGPINAIGVRSCTIGCSGEASCATGELSCTGANKSTISCTGKESCKDGVPNCTVDPNETCKIECAAGKDICATGACCRNNGGGCEVTPGVKDACK